MANGRIKKTGMKVAVFIGGISKGSLNKRFFNEAAKLCAGGDMEFTVADIAALPFFSQDIENDPPRSVREMKSLVAASDAVLFVTPEYNRSIPGVLKNAIDWCSRPPGQSVWKEKPAAMMGATASTLGTFSAQQHLRTICTQLDIRVMDFPAVYFNAATEMNADGLTDRAAVYLKSFFEAFEKWVAIFAGRK